MSAELEKFIAENGIYRMLTMADDPAPRHGYVVSEEALREFMADKALVPVDGYEISRNGTFDYDTKTHKQLVILTFPDNDWDARDKLAAALGYKVTTESKEAT